MVKFILMKISVTNPMSAQIRLAVLSGSAVFYIYKYVKLFKI